MAWHLLGPVHSLWSSPVLYPQSLGHLLYCLQSLVISCTVSSLWSSRCTVSSLWSSLYGTQSVSTPVWSSPVLCPQSLVIPCTCQQSLVIPCTVRSLWS
ncbi:unnamed protein product, partial [Staurois parvus]